MILDIYKDAFEFSSKKISSLFVLGVFSFFGFLIFPLIFFYGYNYNVVKLSTESMINGGDVPPDFTDYKTLFINGLKYFLVNFVYLIIPIIIIILSLNSGNTSIAIGGVILGIILLVLTTLFAFIAIPHMASNEDSLKSAFDVSKLHEIISSIGYGRYFITYVGIALISLAIFIVVILILLILFAILGIAVVAVSPSSFQTIGAFGLLLSNFILGFIVSPYLSIFTNRCMGLMYSLRS